jgi:glycosyltransferase involved in cell wall biosynthesis
MADMPPPRLSLVIPAYNESALLPRLLDSVMVARSRYARGGDAIEVIVADDERKASPCSSEEAR